MPRCCFWAFPYPGRLRSRGGRGASGDLSSCGGDTDARVAPDADTRSHRHDQSDPHGNPGANQHSRTHPRTDHGHHVDDGEGGRTSSVKFLSFENGVLNLERAGEILAVEHGENRPRRFAVRARESGGFVDVKPEQVIPGRTATLRSSVVDGKESFISLTMGGKGGILPAALVNDDSLYEKVGRLRWFSDGLSESEAEALHDLVYIAGKDDSLFEQMLDLPWIADDITHDEERALRPVGKSIARIREYHPGGAGLTRELIDKQWFRDGLDDGEVALMVVLRSFIGQESVLSGLVNDNSILTETVSLPLNGETKLIVVSRSSVTDGDRVLWAASIGLKAMEGFMGEPWPVKRVVFALEPEWNSSAYGTHAGDHILLKHTKGFLVLHELAHFYLTGISPWIDEGGAHFLATYTAGVHEGSVEQVHKNASERLEESVARCAEAGASNIQEWIDAVSDTQKSDSFVSGCHYTLGEAFLLGMYQSLGHDVVAASLRQLYEEKYSHRMKEREIYQAFYDNTPEDKRDEFRELYGRLHGGAIPGN